MPRGNSKSGFSLIDHLRRARSCLDDAIALAEGTQRIRQSERKTVQPNRPGSSRIALDFSMSIRAFVKRHSKGMSGPKKFALLVAYLAKGDHGKRVSRAEVENRWNKLTSVLGMRFNPAHASRAKEYDWVDTEKSGSYYLRPSWKGIFA